MIFFCFRFRWPRDIQLTRNAWYLLSPRLCFFIILKRDLFVYRDDSFTSWRVIVRFCRGRKKIETRGRSQTISQSITQNVRQPYDVRTLTSRHMQGCRKMVMQNLKDCRKTMRYFVQFLHRSRAAIVRFSAVVIRLADFLRQPCNKAHGLAAWVANYNVCRTNTLCALQQYCGSLACLVAVLRLPEITLVNET